MKIKRYTAASMRSALDQVRKEQGPDAVILSSQRIDEGIEVIAAVDYDESLMNAARGRRSPAVTAPMSADAAAVPLSVVASPTLVAPSPAQDTVPPVRQAPATLRPTPAALRPAPVTVRPAPVPAAVRPAPVTARPAPAPATVRPAPVTARPAPAPAPATVRPAAPARASAAPVQAAAASARPVAAPLAIPSDAPQSPASPTTPIADTSFVAMRRELQGLRYLLENELASLTWNDKRLREPLKVRVLEELSALDIAPDVARELAGLAPSGTNLRNAQHIPLALLAKYLPVIADTTCTEGGVVAVVGPTGVGKTTSIAKLAARWTMRHGVEDLALVSTDGYRIGAREQLSTYARILGAPMYAADNGKELARVLERLKSKKLVLIDTAGIGPRDARLNEHLAALKLGAGRARVLLALPAQGEGRALQEITTAFARLAPAACILTKVDEAASLGAAMSTALRQQLPIAYLCNGQRVPEDLHAAHHRRVWLVRAAMRLKENSSPPRDESYLARHFGRGHLHA